MADIELALRRLSSLRDLISFYSGYVAEVSQAVNLLDGVISLLKKPVPEIGAASAQLKELAKMVEPYRAIYPGEAEDVLNRISEIQANLT
jgi:hypothetical protein